MASAVSGNLLPQSDFDISLNLAAAGTTSSVSAFPLHGGNFSITTKPVTDFPSQSQPAVSHDRIRRSSPKSSSSGSPRDSDNNLKPQKEVIANEASKPKRVRTGCLTCRERHLKCDEAVPRCQNCQKSDRLCKRGIRLNFIDTQTVAPPYNITHPPGTRLTFQDESREIASEYKGGFERYPPLNHETPSEEDTTQFQDFSDVLGAPTLSRQSLPVTPSLLPAFCEPPHTEAAEPIFHNNSYSTPPSTFSDQSMSHSSFNVSKSLFMQSSNFRPYLNNAEEVLLMQVFVEEVGLWMDSMDAMKHFSQILPYHALGQPMLLNAFMACGARHLYLVNQAYGEEKALYYYNAASRQLLTCLQNPNRDTVLCATTAVILNVYEVMCEKAMQRMNHIAGARALIKECRWNAKTPGIGGACFWLNVGMELLSCLHFNWKMAWDPDTWDIDMNMDTPGGITGDEELWTHRMVYICAKIANFRSSIPQFQGLDRTAHDIRISQRCQEWNTYKSWCDEWARKVPRSMMPLGYLQPWQTNSKSSFPEVWLIKRSAIVGRLFYHTACTLLAKIHPTESEYSPEMRSMQQSHAHDICGIVAHVKDRGVASVSIRCLAIAAECLVSREAQEEVLEILDKIIKETGWRVGFLKAELQEKWGWTTAAQQSQNPSDNNAMHLGGTDSLLNSAMPSMPPRPRFPSGIVNPMMATADFSMENHPYQNHYVAPHN